MHLIHTRVFYSTFRGSELIEKERRPVLSRGLCHKLYGLADLQRFR